MNDDLRSQPIDPIVADSARPVGASFSGRSPDKRRALRAGVFVGTGLVVAIGAAVAMGASPSPAASGAPGAAQVVPNDGPDVDLGGPGDAGPGFGANGRGHFDGGPGEKGARGSREISITAISGSSVSLATQDGWKRTIVLTSATKVTKGGAAAAIADLTVGDTVRLHQTRNTDGTYTIDAIAIVMPKVGGTVTAIGADTITITLRDGTSQAVRTTGSTTYFLEKAAATRTDVTVGSIIGATGAKASDGSLTADSVFIRLPHVAGSATTIGSDSITITGRGGRATTIHVGATTTFTVAGVASATLSDIKTGMVVMAEGKQRADGSIDATAVAAGNFGRGRGWGAPNGKSPTDAAPSTGPSGSSGSNG